MISCNSDRAITDGGPPPTGEIGSACTDGTVCKSGFCIDDPSFSGHYCSQDCSAGGACPDGATCVDYGGYRFCLDACGADADCREGYVCDYKVCRPRCNRDDLCTAPDTCMQGRCKGGCQTDDDCQGGRRCRGGKCVLPCSKDSDCVPGNTCNVQTGACSPKPGTPLGQACASSGECATGYCLPTRAICSVKCTASSGCPSGYVCGLEKIDKEKNGTFESVEADCVPVKGKGIAGAACSNDSDCASSHCYDGMCMEACAVDADCGSAALQCTEVNVVLDGAIPKYKGCVLRQGVTSYVVGTFTGGPSGAGIIKGIDIPPGAASFVLTTEVSSTTEFTGVAKVVDPAGNTVNELGSASPCDYYSQPDRFYPQEQISSFYLPNTPAVQLRSGVYTFYIFSSQSNLPVTVRLLLKMGQAQKGTLNINWFFLNLAGSCVPGATLNAASAPSHSWMSKVRNNMTSILQGAGLTISKETFQDIKNAALDVIDESATGFSPEVQQLFASSKGIQGNALNIFFVRKIQLAGMSGGEILGQAGGVPGPLGLHGYVHSGLMMSMVTACYEQYGYNPGHTVAHEIGHYLGLFHNQESETEPGLDASSHVVCPCPCGANMSCVSQSSLSWCRGEDPIPDTTTSDKNLMYYAAESTQMFDGNQLTPGQIRVILNSPLVGH